MTTDELLLMSEFTAVVADMRLRISERITQRNRLLNLNPPPGILAKLVASDAQFTATVLKELDTFSLEALQIFNAVVPEWQKWLKLQAEEETHDDDLTPERQARLQRYVDGTTDRTRE